MVGSHLSWKHGSQVQTHNSCFFMLSGSLAGVLEISIFHPVDTTAKRLIVHKGVPQLANLTKRLQTSVHVALGGLGKNSSWGDKITSLYVGARYAVGYKVLQRGYQYSMQPSIAEYLARHRPPLFAEHGNFSRSLEHACAGGIMGCGEVILLPIDSLKVKCQTHMPLSFRSPTSQGLWGTIRSAYRGGAWTAARNGVGSFSLFGGAALTKIYVLNIENFQQATLVDHLVSSTLASMICVWISSPFDLLKTRVQRQGGVHGKEQTTMKVRTGREIAGRLIREEGMRAFFKGSLPKIMVVAPKLMFTYTIANRLSQFFCDTFGA